MESSMETLQKLKIELQYKPDIPLLGIYLKECAPGYNKATGSSILITSLFTIAKLWIQPRCPMTD
jgi:hypothetical protein